MAAWSAGAVDPFIGRKSELAEVARLVVGNRLVTLVGAGGGDDPARYRGCGEGLGWFR